MQSLSKGKLLKVQTRLKELGFNPGPIDGEAGPKTSRAIIAFKKSIGFKPRDYVGPLTYQALFEAPKRQSPDVPAWMDAALKVKGLHEQRNYSKLKKWLWKQWAWLDPRTVPWCGAFVGTCIKKWDAGAVTPANALGARNWAKFGLHCKPRVGAILVFWRGKRSGWKGHVGFYYGEDATHYHVLGGNQSNAVTVSRISKKRLLDSRWPSNHRQTGSVVLPTAKNIQITTNEA